MNINSDINVLGSILDLGIIDFLLKENSLLSDTNENQQIYTSIKTIRSFNRFENAIKNTIIRFDNPKIEVLVQKVLENEGISFLGLRILFLNASFNNELLDYINQKVYFPALYSGRVAVKTEEVLACLMELKQIEISMQKWSDSTLKTTASKYLTLLKKFNLMEGGARKTIAHHHVSDKEFIFFVYWLLAIEDKANILDCNWLKYSFLDNEMFVQHIMQKKYMKYVNVIFTGDKLKIENNFSYEVIYDELK